MFNGKSLLSKLCSRYLVWRFLQLILSERLNLQIYYPFELNLDRLWQTNLQHIIHSDFEFEICDDDGPFSWVTLNQNGSQFSFYLDLVISLFVVFQKHQICAKFFK